MKDKNVKSQKIQNDYAKYNGIPLSIVGFYNDYYYVLNSYSFSRMLTEITRHFTSHQKTKKTFNS